jgi:hypothetical protein
MTTDGREAQNLTDHVAVSTARNVAEHRPRFVSGTSTMVMAEYLEEGEGERLVLFDYTARNRVRILVQTQKNAQILFTVSPDGKYIAYYPKQVQGNTDPRIVVIDLMGTILATIPLPRTLEIESLAWGAQRNSLFAGGTN